MLIIVGEGEKEFTNGSLLIKLSNLDNFIGVTIIDNNVKRAQKKVRKKLQYVNNEEVIDEREGQHGGWVKKACFFAKFFYVSIEKGKPLPFDAQQNNDLCPLEPYRPEPCYDAYGNLR